jgi:hypothetical protein
VRARTDPRWQAMRPPLLLSLGLGSFWIWVANAQPVAAAVMLIFMAATAIAAFLRAPAGVWGAGPVGLYAGWVTAACGAGVGIVLGGQGVLTGQNAAYLMLSAVVVVAITVVRQRPAAPGFAFGVGWALLGVMVANASAANFPVVGLAGVGLAALGGTLVLCRRNLR